MVILGGGLGYSTLQQELGLCLNPSLKKLAPVNKKLLIFDALMWVLFVNEEDDDDDGSNK